MSRTTFIAGLLIAGAIAANALAQTAAPPRAVPSSPPWRALEERRFAEAVELFEDAARLAPRDASLRFGAGLANLMQGKNAAARRGFDAALAIDPRLIDASVFLGLAYYRDGLLQDAIKVYENALRYAPDATQLTGPLAQWRKEVSTEGQFYQAQGAHFTVFFEGPADDAAAQRALEILEDAYWRIGRELAVYPQRPLSVVLYTTEQFRDVTRSPEWASGVYDGRIKVPIGGEIESAELRRVLEHELVHAIVAAIAGPTVPAWLNEGLATALERDGTEWAEAARTPSQLVAELPREFRNLMPAQAREAYATSTRVVLRLLEQHGSAAVVELLRGIGRGLPFLEAFQGAVGTTFDDFVSVAR